MESPVTDDGAERLNQEAFGELTDLRTESLVASELHPMDPVDLPGGS